MLCVFRIIETTMINQAACAPFFSLSLYLFGATRNTQSWALNKWSLLKMLKRDFFPKQRYVCQWSETLKFMLVFMRTTTIEFISVSDPIEQYSFTSQRFHAIARHRKTTESLIQLSLWFYLCSYIITLTRFSLLFVVEKNGMFELHSQSNSFE